MVDEPIAPAAEPATPPADATPPAPAAASPAPPAVAPDWADDWRLKAARGDEKIAKAYEKYASPADVLDAHRSLQQQLSTGEYKKKLSDKATPEEITAWRKDNGIPESPEKYDLNLPDGLVLGENDLPVAKDFAAVMHGVNADQKTVQTAITWWTKNAKAAVEARQADDAEYKKQTEDVLHAEWGGEYRMNEGAIGNLMAGIPELLQKKLMGARDDSTGRLLWDDPSFRSYLLDQATNNGLKRFVPPGTDGNSVDNIAQALADIAKISREEPQRYNKDKAMQDRREKLLKAQEILQNRNAA